MTIAKKENVDHLMEKKENEPKKLIKCPQVNNDPMEQMERMVFKDLLDLIYYSIFVQNGTIIERKK